MPPHTFVLPILKYRIRRNEYSTEPKDYSMTFYVGGYVVDCCSLDRGMA